MHAQNSLTCLSFLFEGKNNLFGDFEDFGQKPKKKVY